MNDGIAKAIIGKSAQLNKSPSLHLERVAEITRRLDSYICSRLSLEIEEIQKAVAALTLYTSLVPVSIPLVSGTVLSRAVIYEEQEGAVYEKATRLSCIQRRDRVIQRQGRLNQLGESIFYLCLNSDSNSVETLLSESRADEGDVFNILQCRIKLGESEGRSDVTLQVVPIGINDYFRRGLPAPFNLHDSFRKRYELYRENTHPTAMLAMQVCEAFLTDVLTRTESPRLYDVTSEIGRECLKSAGIDGILYPSAKFEGFPNLALKPRSVDSKIRFETALSLEVERCFGYGLYRTKTLRQGIVSGQDVFWR